MVGRTNAATNGVIRPCYVGTSYTPPTVGALHPNSETPANLGSAAVQTGQVAELAGEVGTCCGVVWAACAHTRKTGATHSPGPV
jgi:hypothetical protein